MLVIKINGTDSGIKPASVSRFTDLVELIKASIDPDHMITAIKVNGVEADDKIWATSVNPADSITIDVETGAPEAFVKEKMAGAPEIIKSCYMEFRDARKSFQGGNMLEGNQALARAVNTAKSFFDWYAAIVQLISAEKRSRYDITTQVNEISEICKKICQQQLYQSWWALWETLEKELEPKLDKLEDFCRGFK